jgi:hypothetical protein
MLHKQKQGYPVLGHTTHKFLFHVLAYDRGKNAFMRTMRRLNLLENDIPTTPLRLAFGTDAVQGIINEVEKLNPIPSIIFIEGLDMLIDDANKKSTVSPFMRQLQEVAAHFHIALICSVGAPKTKRGEDYAAKRDKLSGSEAWGRNCETVAVLEFSEEDDGTAPRRELTILPRNASAEKFSLEFQSGRLVQVEAKADEDPEEKNTGGAPPIARQRAIHLIEMALQHGPLPDKTVRMIVKKQGVDKMAVKRAADDMIDRGQLLVGAVVAGGNMWELAPMHEMEEDPSTFVTDVSFDTGDNQ